ncbi:unnamed protein product [Vitrella brassicaformis CCMP3155]|uniref:Uncharacterized protein n=1 Tax=Vitrella brassicaformis (strain CCMP3155) TaxID=1169540 RepID=A0A0G4GDA1_VITBC|nr:unnamed protein product [Vitrella brassicaformis CCMP3155]|eukprot:CEM26985.1 unnamed protein product [Vitrella brassicaformis CCMP3155]
MGNEQSSQHGGTSDLAVGRSGTSRNDLRGAEGDAAAPVTSVTTETVDDTLLDDTGEKCRPVSASTSIWKLAHVQGEHSNRVLFSECLSEYTDPVEPSPEHNGRIILARDTMIAYHFQAGMFRVVPVVGIFYSKIKLRADTKFTDFQLVLGPDVGVISESLPPLHWVAGADEQGNLHVMAFNDRTADDSKANPYSFTIPALDDPAMRVVWPEPRTPEGGSRTLVVLHRDQMVLWNFPDLIREATSGKFDSTNDAVLTAAAVSGLKKRYCKKIQLKDLFRTTPTMAPGGRSQTVDGLCSKSSGVPEVADLCFSRDGQVLFAAIKPNHIVAWLVSCPEKGAPQAEDLFSHALSSDLDSPTIASINTFTPPMLTDISLAHHQSAPPPPEYLVVGSGSNMSVQFYRTSRDQHRPLTLEQTMRLMCVGGVGLDGPARVRVAHGQGAGSAFVVVGVPVREADGGLVQRFVLIETREWTAQRPFLPAKAVRQLPMSHSCVDWACGMPREHDSVKVEQGRSLIIYCFERMSPADRTTRKQAELNLHHQSLSQLRSPSPGLPDTTSHVQLFTPAEQAPPLSPRAEEPDAEETMGAILPRYPRILPCSDASRRLSEAIIRRTIAGEQHMTQLIQRYGTDPNVEPLLRLAGTTGRYVAYPLLSLCIDNLRDNLTHNSVPSIWGAVGEGECPVAMPTWETPSLQLAVMRSLIERGADINRGAGVARPIRVAIASCNQTAFDLLMGRPGIQLRGLWVIHLPFTLPTDQPTEAHERTLLSFYRQLIQRDSTLATERGPNGTNLVHVAALSHSVWSQQFIENYIDLLVTNGVDIKAVDIGERTPLHYAAGCGCHCVAASLCRRLTAADINRGVPNDPTLTLLTYAARQLDEVTQQLRDDTTEQPVRDQATVRIPKLQKTVRVLLQAGADIALMPTAREEDRRRHQLVLAERMAAANELPIPEPHPATIEAQGRLQKMKEHRDKRKGRQATREANEAPTAAELARQQREADALIREEEANKKEAAAKAKAGKKGKGKRGKGQHSATSTPTAAGSRQGGEDDRADSTGAADDDDQPDPNDEDSDALLLASAFAQRAIESRKQANNPKQPKGSTHPPFLPFQHPTAKQQATLPPSADKSRSHRPHNRPLLSRPSGVSTADQTPGEERLAGPSADSKLGRGSGFGLSAAAPSLLSRAAAPPPHLPSAVELRDSGKRRPFVSSSPTHPPPPRRPLPPAHRPASGADESVPPPAHAPQQPDDLLPSSSTGHRPSCHRGPPPLVKCPKSSGASLSHDDACRSPLFELRSAADACPSSSSYDDSSAAPAAPAAAAAAAFGTPSAPYEAPLGPSHYHEDRQGASASAHHGAAAAAPAVDDIVRQRDELARQLEETQRRLAELTTTAQQHQPSSSGSSSAPLSPQQTRPQQPQPPAGTGADSTQAGGCIICFGEHGPASIMYVPCRHMHICHKCYAHRRDAWHHSLPRLKADNARRAEENKARIKRDQEPLELRPEGYLCEQCQTEVVFAGSMDEVLRWIGQPFT